jgi:hypothetical protein
LRLHFLAFALLDLHADTPGECVHHITPCR